VLAAIAPDALVVGRRPPGEAPVAPPMDWLRSRLAELPADELGGLDPATADILLLTPRYQASAHVVALVVARDGGSWRPALVIKAARLAAGRATLAQEVAALRDLGPTLGASGQAPRLVAADVEGSPPWLIETALQGRPLDPATVRRDRAGATDAVTAFVRALPARREAAGAPGRLALDALARLGAARVAPDLLERTRSLVPGLAESIPAVFEHGDLAHPNLLLRADGSVAAVDWERAEPTGWPLHDLTVALGYIAAAAAGATSPSDQAAAVRRALIGDDAWATPHVEAELDRLAIDRGAGLALMTIAWMRTAAFLAGRAGGDWLEGDRSIALWRATLGLAEGARETST
jgi:aminoglycoside phosphotransferase